MTKKPSEDNKPRAATYEELVIQKHEAWKMIEELETKVEELEGLRFALSGRIEQLEQQLREKDKHDCEKWVDEGMGCSICSQVHVPDKERVKEVQEFINWKLAEQSKLLEVVVGALKTIKPQLYDAVEGVSGERVALWQTLILQVLHKLQQHKEKGG